MKVDKEDMQALLEWSKTAKVLFAAQFGKGINKEFFATVSGSYEVYSKGSLVLATNSPGRALKCYNEIERTVSPPITNK